MAVFDGLVKDYSTFEGAQLLAKDFDGTVAMTFEPSPSGIGVHQVYDIAIEELFGTTSLQTYIDNGGLGNRNPIEVVKQLAPDAKERELKELVARFNDVRLSILLGEIGTLFPDGSAWPRPSNGYIELRESLETAHGQGQLIDDIIISSGHEAFIEKTYSVWGLSQPTHVLAFETVERLNLGTMAVKPSSILMDAAHRMWREGYGLSGVDMTDRERMLYVGDDPIKDGQLAGNSGVNFLLLEPETSERTWRVAMQILRIGEFAV